MAIYSVFLGGAPELFRVELVFYLKMATILNHNLRNYLQTAARRYATGTVVGPSAVSGGHEGNYITKYFKTSCFYFLFSL